MRLALLLLVAACAQTGRAVRVTAAREPGGVRVVFRRKQGTEVHRPHLHASGGSLEERILSPDGLSVSVFWREPEGELRCAFPHGGFGIFSAGDPVDAREVEYVFLAAKGVRVTAVAPRAALLRPALELRVEIDKAHLPARLEPPGRDLEQSVTVHTLVLHRESGDREFTLRTASGATFIFLVGVDPDGTPTATSGYVRNW